MVEMHLGRNPIALISLKILAKSVLIGLDITIIRLEHVST